MSDVSPICPECGSEHTYEMDNHLVCSMCAHEWNPAEATQDPDAVPEIRDAVGNILSDGDSVTVVQDLKVKGAQSVLKAGTKVRDIKLVQPVDGHDIDCRIDGFGRMKLKSSIVKKI